MELQSKVRTVPCEIASAEAVTTLGWEVARQLERDKPTVLERLKPDRRMVRAALVGMISFFTVFLVGCWLAGNPFSATQRVASEFIMARGWAGTDAWSILWGVVGIAIILEFLDAAAGMGYGTAITPLLMLLGFDPIQIVPAVMIQQAVAGLTGAFLHNEFGNVEWKFKPMSETVKLWLIISLIGCLAVVFSITAVYGILKMAKVWIKVYVAILLVVMGVSSLIVARKDRAYKPGKMFFFGAMAGFNKGVGGGGYGPVVTVGGILSGVPVKSMLAVTAISEGTVCVCSIVVWLVMLRMGTVIDFILLPSMLLGSMVAAVAAPYATRIFPEKAWRTLVPLYCCILAVWCFWKAVPEAMTRLFY
ncbi:MAG: sulfite exporter TauE/SafE family protein [bacterium]|nr:sulfite exporter TauE/SafE family protein [bacterium]MDT8395597.1 sulfite exporter TauE/SafE family protein [bacterium]